MNLPYPHRIAYSGRNTCLPKASSPTLTAGQEDDYGECDATLQSYNCDSVSSLPTDDILQSALGLLNKSLKNLRTKENRISLVEGGGAYVYQPGPETRIEVRIRGDVPMVHMSVVVYRARHGDVSSTTARKVGGYSSLMTMMRLNSLLSRTSCGGRICTYDGQFLFFQDLPVSILNENGLLHRKLDEFKVKTAEIQYGFNVIPGKNHISLGLI